MIVAAFENHIPPRRDGEALLPLATKTDGVRTRLALSEIDHALLRKDRGYAARMAATAVDQKDATVWQLTIESVLASLRMPSWGRIRTIDADRARSGWVAAARLTNDALDWSAFDVADGSLSSQLGKSLRISTATLAHDGGRDGFSPGPVIALLDRGAEVRIEAVQRDPLGDRTAIYASVSWTAANVAPVPCTELDISVLWCGSGDRQVQEARANTFATYLIDHSHIRQTCVTVREDTTPTSQPPGDHIDLIAEMQAELASLQLTARLALATTEPVPQVAPDHEVEAPITVHLCELPPPPPPVKEAKRPRSRAGVRRSAPPTPATGSPRP